ncbi:MAG TPA: hypothetical protein PKY92_06230 [Chitinophagales bacterium]|nr:hypothetical protein [Chitinophagales bacterium]
MMDNLMNHPGVIAGFAVIVVAMLVLDLGIFNKKSHEIKNKEAIGWSILWISLSMIFSGVIYHFMGVEKFAQFQSAYWIEKALSVDNLFVFILVFQFYKVKKEYQHKVLFWGIIGALIMRAIFIFAGVGLIKLTYLPPFELFGAKFMLSHASDVVPNYDLKEFYRPNVVLSIFGFFLIYAGITSWFANDNEDAEKDFSSNLGAKFVNRFYKVKKQYFGDKFFVVEDGIRYATLLFVVLAVIEFTDLIFAVDSIPAIFAIAPDDPMILYTSNIFAILGLRSLYFLLANFMYMFSKLKYGLAIILTFIGFKMVFAPFLHVPSVVSLGIVGGILILSVAVSLLFPEKKPNSI